jgi:hypothetical protein
MSTKSINPWDWDVRVRERNLKNGSLTEKELDKHLGQLADVAEQCEPVSLPQPALGGREDSV